MEFTRHHYLALGIVLLLVGIQFRVVQSFSLNKETSQFIAEKFEGKAPAGANTLTSIMSVSMPTQLKKVEPPRWVGWSLVSVGAVLVLHALAMKNP